VTHKRIILQFISTRKLVSCLTHLQSCAAGKKVTSEYSFSIAHDKRAPDLKYEQATFLLKFTCIKRFEISWIDV